MKRLKENNSAMKSARIGLAMCSIAFFAFANLRCSSSSGPCSRLSHAERSGKGIIGCYSLIAYVGGIIGGYREAHDDQLLIVLTPDSLYSEYYKDSLQQTMKFHVSWKEELHGAHIASLSFEYNVNGENLNVDNFAASWRNDTLWTGHEKMYPDAQGAVYRKCCK
jgi:hypothetical protein